jgi:hypothetical protein
MWFRLAKELGMSVKRCQQEVDSAEFTDWIAYYGIEPFGERFADIRAGTIASVVANANLSKDSKPFSPLDFVPWAKEPEPEGPPPSPEAVAASVFGINLAELKQNGTKTIVIKGRNG